MATMNDRCRPKTGWLSGETYCAVHGRSAGWPCEIAVASSTSSSSPAFPNDAGSEQLVEYLEAPEIGTVRSKGKA